MIRDHKFEAALGAIRQKTDSKPLVGLILGSGLGSVAEDFKGAVKVAYEDITHWPRSTAPGHSGFLTFGELNDVPVVTMSGRAHYYEGYSMDDITLPIRVFHALGVKVLLATNASGGINLDYKPGDLVAIGDHINLMGTNPLIGPNDDSWGPRFPDMTYAYDRKLADVLHDVAKKENITLHDGVYIAFSGPSYETPAEIRMARTMGADLVGMSTVPEIIVANHMGMRACAVSCVSNHAAGITQDRLRHDEVLERMAAAADRLSTLVRGFIGEIGKMKNEL